MLAMEPPMTMDEIRHTLTDELLSVNLLIKKELFSDVGLIDEIVAHIIDSGGKRTRPLVLLMMARALGYLGDEHIELAAVIEFIHTATLLHDDVIDNSHLRRGQQTANSIWDNQASVLTGDFLYSRAFQLLARRANVPVMKVLAQTTNLIAEGEMLQLMNQHEPEIHEAEYFKVIDRKTAKLFEAGCHIGALIATNNTHLHQCAAYFGHHIGLAYQLVDDALDYFSSTDTMGKERGNDLQEGKITLPFIYALSQTEQGEAESIKTAIREKDTLDLNQISDWILEKNGHEYTLNKAREHVNQAKKCLEPFPDSRYKTALISLAEFIVARNY